MSIGNIVVLKERTQLRVWL